MVSNPLTGIHIIPNQGGEGTINLCAEHRRVPILTWEGIPNIAQIKATFLPCEGHLTACSKICNAVFSWLVQTEAMSLDSLTHTRPA